MIRARAGVSKAGCAGTTDGDAGWSARRPAILNVMTLGARQLVSTEFYCASGLKMRRGLQNMAALLMRMMRRAVGVREGLMMLASIHDTEGDDGGPIFILILMLTSTL